MTNILLILTSLAAFAVPHSLTASLASKAAVRRRIGGYNADGLYRVAYNLLSVITVVPPFALAILLPDGPPIWTIPAPLLVLTIPVQVAAAFGMALSLWRVGLPRFLGLRQFARWLRPPPPGPSPEAERHASGEGSLLFRPVLRTDGIHGWVRHPLYFFSLVVLYLIPEMTPNRLALTLGVHGYFWIGSIFEERKLVAEFGEAYREHQRRVPRLLPFPRPRGRYPDSAGHVEE